MGNCCGDKAQSPNNTQIVSQQCQKIYQLESIDIQNHDSVLKYCEDLKNLQHANVKQLTVFINQSQPRQSMYMLHFSRQEYTDLAKYMDLKKNSILSSQIAKLIIRQVCQGLVYLHTNQIIHGDLNFKNIEINPNTNEIQIKHNKVIFYENYFFISEYEYPTQILTKTYQELITASYQINKNILCNQCQMKEFESPEKSQDENITFASDLYSLGVLSLSLYGVSFQSNLKMSKPVHCPFGLYEKLRALTSQNPDQRPPIDDIIDALDFETNPESIQNLDQKEVDKQNISKNNKEANQQNQELASLQSQKSQRDQQTIHETNIDAVIASQKQLQTEHQNSIVKNDEQIKYEQVQAQSVQNQQQNESLQKLTIKSEKIIQKTEPEKIEYDFNPHKQKQAKDQNYKNPMKTLHFYQDHESLITSITSDSSQNYIFTSSLDGSIIVYQFDSNTKQLKQHKKLTDFVYGVSQVIVTADNNYLIASDLSSNIYIYSLKDFKLFKKISNLFEKHCILSIDISADNQFLLISATYKTVLFCNLKNFEKHNVKDLFLKIVTQKQNMQGLSSNGQICRFFQNQIIIGEESGKILVYKQDNLITPIKELNNHNNAITQISIGSSYFAVSSQDKNISIFDQQLNKIQSLSIHIDCVANVYLSKDANILTSNGWDGSTCLYLKNSSGEFELQSCFPNETSWSVSSIYIQKSKLLISSGGRFLFIFTQ